MTEFRPKPERTASFSPLYKQIKDLLLQSLEAGDYKPGESIPSEQELANRYQVSQGTVRKAIDELSAENVLIRRQGKGTFVATHHEAEVRYRFLRLFADNSDDSKRAQSHFLSCEEQEPSAEHKRVFELNRDEKVICIKRVMNLLDHPTIYEEIYLPANTYKGMSLALLVDNRDPLYGLFESKFGVQLIRCDEKLKAVGAPADVATLLQVSEDAPLLSIERVSYTFGDKPMEIRTGLYSTEHHHYRNSLY